MAGFYFSVFETGFIDIFPYAVLSAMLIALMRLRPFAGPLLAVVSLAAYALYRLFSGNLAQWAVYWLNFFEWAFLGGAYDPVFSGNGSIFFFRISIIFMITFAVLFFMRKLFNFILLVCVTAGVLATLYIMSRADISGAICVASAGLIIAMPRAHAAYIARSAGGEHTVGIRAPMQIIAIPAAVLAAVLSFHIVPQDASEWRSKCLNDLIYDVSSFFTGPEGVQSGSGNFSMHNFGFQQSSGRLGGPVSLKTTKLLTVKGTSRPLLLRGAVMDYYDGESWHSAWTDGDYRYRRFFWRGYRNEAFGLTLPAGSAEAKKLFQSMCEELRITLAYEINSFTSIFAGGRVRNVDMVSYNDEIEPFFNLRSELYTHGRISIRDEITLRASLPDRTAPDFDENFLELERLLSGVTDEHYEALYSRYTMLPDMLPESVMQMALEITAGETSPYLKAKALESWLRDNFTYTLEPDMPPDGVDFVGHFLDTQEGYCTYYATAMAILARCAGLPSRYVTGLALERNADDPSVFIATGKTVHAWAEIYFNGIGWIEFDPLDWNADAPLNRDAEPPPPPPPSTASETAPESHTTDDSPYSPPENPPLLPAQNERADMMPYIMLALGFISLPFIFRELIKLTMGTKLRQFEPNRVIRKSGSLDAALTRYYTDILRQLALLDIEPRPGETLVTFPARVDKRIATDGPRLTDIADPLMRARFAGESPSRADIDAAWNYHSRLEALVIEKYGKARYIIRRLILK